MAKKKSFVGIIVCLLLCLSIIPLILNLTRQKNDVEMSTDSYLVVVETNIEFAEGSYSLDLENGYIKTNVEVDKVFINAMGVGIADLTFTTSVMQVGNSTYVLHKLSPQRSLCSTVFANDSTVLVDVYVEYDGRTYRVDRQTVEIESAWTEAY